MINEKNNVLWQSELLMNKKKKKTCNTKEICCLN